MMVCMSSYKRLEDLLYIIGIIGVWCISEVIKPLLTISRLENISPQL